MSLAKLLIGSITGKAKSIKTGRGVNVLNHRMKNIDGQEISLDQFQGKVLLLVNVASKCGMTPQYAQLVELQNQYHARGFEVLGFPANDFMGQEPGSEPEIKTFCDTKYNVNFPLFAKISVKGNTKDPLYADLTAPDKNGDLAGEITWNFTKFIVGRDGHVVARAEPQMKPDDPRIIDVVEQELAKPAP